MFFDQENGKFVHCREFKAALSRWGGFFLDADGMLDECLRVRTVAIGSRRRLFLTAFGSISDSE
jgi:hypothetical protein